MKQIIVDCHSHTNNSPDSKASIESMCEAAVSKGLAAYTVSDHCEMNEFYGVYEITSQKSSEAITKAQKLFPELNLLKGIELGQPMQNTEASDYILDTRDFDFVLASIHNPPNEKDYAFLKYDEENVKVIMKNYFEEMYEMVKWGRFDSLAHITYPIRYMTGEQKVNVPIDKFKDIICAIFEEIIKKDIALEMNTAGYRVPIGEPSPNKELLSLYKDCGGKLVTLGADAHSPEHVAFGIEKGIALLKDAGFDSFVYYKGRKPVEIPIV